MYFIKFILLCFGVAFIGASLFKLRFEKSITIFFLGTIVILYQAYILNIVYICTLGIVCGIVIGGIVGIIKLFRDRSWKKSLERIICPISISYVLVLCIIWYLVRFNQVSLIDELHLWGALPKILYFEKGRQQLTNSLLLSYNDYIPGMPLFLYFLEFINGSFKEALLYFGYTALGSILLLGGMFEKLNSYKRWYFIPAAGVIVCLLPLMFYNNIYNDHTIYYKSLHVDMILGIFAGYATWLLAKKAWQKTADMICMILALTVLALLKSSGIMFAVLVGVAGFFYICLKDKAYRKRAIGLIVIPCIFYFEWTIILKIKNVGLTVADYSIADIFSTEYLRGFWNLIWNRELIYLPVFEKMARISNFGILFLILCALVLLGSLAVKKTYYYYVNAIMILQVILFTAGVYGLFAGHFQGSELSYARYVCTGLTAFLCYIAMFLINNLDRIGATWKSNKKDVLALGLPIILLLFLFPKTRPQGISYPLSALQDADKLASMINYSEKTGVESGERILLLMDEDYNSFSPDLYLYFWRRLYFDLLDENKKVEDCRFVNTYTERMELEGEEKEIYLSGDYKTEEYDYIYKIDYISDDEITGTLYKILNRTEKMYSLRFTAQYSLR